MLYTFTKRLIDLAASIILILLFLPIWVLIPILIRLESNGPILFLQERVGKGGKIFKIIKFRSMIEEADEYWKKNPALYEKFKNASWKLTLEEDPRVTKLGKVLRQTSIDEFPQVFNILLGSMSLVGPRPCRENEIKDAIKRYGKKIKTYVDESLKVKPGLTGMWQVSGRNDVGWVDRVKMDAGYAKRQNIIDDLTIILKTPLAMISKW